MYIQVPISLTIFRSQLRRKRRKLYFTVVHSLVAKSQKLLHMPRQQGGRVVITWLEFGSAETYMSIEFGLWWKTRQWNGSQDIKYAATIFVPRSMKGSRYQIPIRDQPYLNNQSVVFPRVISVLLSEWCLVIIFSFIYSCPRGLWDKLPHLIKWSCRNF